MKKIIATAIILTALLGVSAYASPKTDLTIEYKYLITLDDNVKRKMRLKPEDSEKKSGVIVAFKDTEALALDEFEVKYGLKFKTKMLIGYYIFENISSKSDIQIVEQIMQESENINTLKPNWKMDFKLY